MRIGRADCIAERSAYPQKMKTELLQRVKLECETCMETINLINFYVAFGLGIVGGFLLSTVEFFYFFCERL